MKRNQKLYYLCLAVLLVGITSCVEELLLTQKRVLQTQTALSVEEAKAFFEKQMEEVVITRSTSGSQRPKGVLPGEFTPLWDRAMTSENSNVASVDVPILSQNRYKAIRSEVKNGKASAYTVELTQKLVVVKSKSEDKLVQYIMTLIPDREYYKSNKGDISDRLLNSGSDSKFSGVVVYSIWKTGYVVKVDKYRDGKLHRSLFLPDKDGKNSVIKRERANRLIGEIKILVSKKMQTRSWGEDDEEDPSVDGGCLICKDRNCDGYCDGFIVTPEPKCPVCGEEGCTSCCTICGNSPCTCGLLCPTCGYVNCTCKYECSTCGKDPCECVFCSICQRFDCNGDCFAGEISGGGNGEGDSDDDSEIIKTNKILADKNNFVGYNTITNCKDACDAILRRHGISDTGSPYHVFKLMNEIGDGTNRHLSLYGNNPKQNYANAIACIDRHLEAGRPILIGVNRVLDRGINEGTTDHFIVVNGRERDAETGLYHYTYYEVGTGTSAGYDSTKNRLIYDPDIPAFYDETGTVGGKRYDVTQVRPNDGNNLGTTSQYSN